MAEQFVIYDSGGKPHEVLEVYESFCGWYWYITEKYPDEPDVVYGFVQGLEEEWGDIYLPELEEMIAIDKVWSVPRANWSWTGRGTPIKVVQ